MKDIFFLTENFLMNEEWNNTVGNKDWKPEIGEKVQWWMHVYTETTARFGVVVRLTPTQIIIQPVKKRTGPPGANGLPQYDPKWDAPVGEVVRARFRKTHFGGNWAVSGDGGMQHTLEIVK